MNIDSSGGETYFDFKGGNGQLDYTVGGKDNVINVVSQGMPMPPISAEIETLDIRFALPVAPADSANEAAILVNMDGVSVGEQLWAMVDPGAAIPRDPATILLDLTSTARASVNIMDPENAAMMAGMPITFEDVTLKDLRISFGGAEVTGQGAATINNAGPVPMPVGGIDLRISGVQGLTQTLSSLGLLQPEQAMPVQMMLGMFAKPTGEPDVFTSRIEADANGSISANGIPLQ